eukprot:CAMPEP_0176255982 /NCGR_PEP_ID=MMETSP0121_2-20121125/37314_1 /TAXON_ID=160619 /ORGANISM="Kryptoperidinium foliaceum, Strain CCMP 1326" /LENGTH=292 /DNA_ID=CAMNT_0017595811 /DNA_START=30 /DNA_END=908 /DNA_ORIENTATION=+
MTQYCNLEAAGAVPLGNQMYMTAGPKNCQGLAWMSMQLGIDAGAAPADSDARLAVESAIQAAIADTSAVIELDKMQVVTDTTTYGFRVIVVMAANESVPIARIKNALNHNLTDLERRVVAKISAIPGLTASSVATVTRHTLTATTVRFYNESEGGVELEIQHLTPAFVSQPFQGISDGSLGKALGGKISAKAVKAQDNGMSSRQFLSRLGRGVLEGPSAGVIGAFVALAMLIVVFGRNGRMAWRSSHRGLVADFHSDSDFITLQGPLRGAGAYDESEVVSLCRGELFVTDRV